MLGGRLSAAAPRTTAFSVYSYIGNHNYPGNVIESVKPSCVQTELGESFRSNWDFYTQFSGIEKE